MRDALGTYFAAEKTWTLSLAFLGGGLLALAIWLWMGKGTYRGAAIPVGLVALVELGVGLGVGLRTDGQVAQLMAQLESSPAAMASDELSRMAGVMRSFRMVEIVELCLFAVAVVLVFAGARSDFWFAFGVGLLAQTSLMLTFDLIAERRAVAYVAALRDAGPT